MFFAGPGIAAGGSLAAARTVDLAPTVLEMLGCPPDAVDGMQGRSLLSDLLSAEPVTP